LRLGQSVFPLNGPWKFTVGDSPVDPETGQPLWSEPDFDDSQWETVDLTPAKGSSDLIAGLSGFVPGWTARGHAGYWGYAWYRIRVQLDDVGAARPGEKLALAMADGVDDVFQIFANGRLLGGFGDFSGKTPVTYYSVPTIFPLPEPAGILNRVPAGGSGGSRTEVVTFRVWMGPGELLTQPDAGGLHSAPVLGEAGAVAADYELRWRALVDAYLSYVVEGAMFALMALAAFSLVLFDRSDRVYQWIGAVFLLEAIQCGLAVVISWTQLLSMTASTLLGDCFLPALMVAGWAMVWWIWFGRPRPAWIPRAAVVLGLLFFISLAIGRELFFGLVPHGVAAQFEVATLLLRVLSFALMLWIVIQGIRRQGLEGWLVLPAVLLWSVTLFSTELRLMQVQLNLHLLGLTVDLAQIAHVLMALAVVVLLLRRLLRSVEAQRELALDVKQVQVVQQVILPEALLVLPRLTVESVYWPAREVGGDFFQVVPHVGDGSVLIVAGDVSGKGLQAGMLVALLVGAIRMAAEISSDPQFVLEALNRRLLGRTDAQATCLVMRIDASGQVTLANAGHIAPYLNREQVDMEGALPLGMIEGAEFSLMRFQLQDNDKLVLLSDGIVEATDADGNLFGFERVHQLLQTVDDAVQIAESAQQFGQEDDISVISVTRTAAAQPAAVPQPALV
jgi:hypothetical protein